MREEHNRFLHYYNGFYVNQQAEEASKAMKEGIEAKCIEYKEMTGGDPEFLREAVDALIRVSERVQ